MRYKWLWAFVTTNVSEVQAICKSAIDKIQNVPISYASYQAAVNAKEVMETADEIKAIRSLGVYLSA